MLTEMMAMLGHARSYASRGGKLIAAHTGKAAVSVSLLGIAGALYGEISHRHKKQDLHTQVSGYYDSMVEALCPETSASDARTIYTMEDKLYLMRDANPADLDMHTETERALREESLDIKTFNETLADLSV